MSSTPTAPGLLHGVRDTLASAGVRQVSDAETWVNAEGELLVKIAVAPDERAGAAEIPERLLQALRTDGYALAATSDSAAPDSLSPDEALRAGHAVRVTRG
ncbi:hypothetical protein AB0393_28070 [Streptomyces cyaneofuscatus]|uniref:hypothetical protein n=1 Tax=Streptomyces cyaneofuscatus TaxID=66883 RepID=UPI00344CAA5C